MGGLSGGGRGGDKSGAASSSFIRQCPAPSPTIGLCFCRQRLMPSLLHEESVCQRRFPHLPAQDVSHTLTDRLQSAGQALSFPPAFVLGASMPLSRGVLAGPGLASGSPSAITALLPVLARMGVLPGRGRSRCASTPLSHRSSCTTSPCSVPHVRHQQHWGALHHVALPVSFHRRQVLWCEPFRCRQALPRVCP